MHKPYKTLITLTVIFCIGTAAQNLPTDHDSPSKPLTESNTLTVPQAMYEPTNAFQPCQQEDSTARSCVWDASERGNRYGHSFHADSQGNLTYIPDHTAKIMLSMEVDTR